jgi:exo-beta-1,3-glucanase (GH17 family)
MKPPATLSSWRAIGVVVAVAGLLATGASSNGSRPRLADPPAASFACNQPFPSAGPGRVTLSGVGYGPYHAGQDPNYGISPSSSEVAADMPTLSAITNYIRIYSSTGPAAEILRAAEAAHMCVSLGIWLGRNSAANAAEMAAGIRLARQFRAVRSVIVGNEVLLRGDLPVNQLIQDIGKVRAALGHTVAISCADDFKQWLAHPELARAVDFVTAHIYPFWLNVPIGSAIRRLGDDYGRVARRFAGKPIVLGETGWPSAADTPSPGDTPPPAAAVPSPQNQARYFRGVVTWAAQHHVPYFYFDAFDEDWKTTEHGVGTHWGLYQLDGHLKPALARWLPAANPATVTERSYRDVFVGSKLEKPFDLGIDTDRHRRHWLTATPGMLTMAYPAGQQWGAMFITAGRPAPLPDRHSIDLSQYRSLTVQLRARANGQRVRLGIKDWSQPDNGGEITVEYTLTTHWSTVALPLSLFANVDQRHLYVVFEVVFLGSAAETVDMRDLRYSPAQVPAPVFGPAPMPFAVYTDGADPANHYVPSGYIGDFSAVTQDQFWARDPHHGKTCIRVVYSGPVPGGVGWAGVYWQNPVDNWGAVPGPTGYDLSRASRLTFWVRGQTGTESVQFLAGGITGTYGDSLQPAVKTPVLTLSTTWQQVTIDLTGTDLTHIIGGFGWVARAQDNPYGATFYLDDITYSA